MLQFCKIKLVFLVAKHFVDFLSLSSSGGILCGLCKPEPETPQIIFLLSQLVLLQAFLTGNLR